MNTSHENELLLRAYLYFFENILIVDQFRANKQVGNGMKVEDVLADGDSNPLLGLQKQKIWRD